ncbi:MAG: hypothetical protein O2897_06165 [bacterium]|nr:hypothetical protein [bacterium]
MMPNAPTAFSHNTYQDILQLNDEKQIQFAEEIALALQAIDPTLLPLQSAHPFSNFIKSAGEKNLDLIQVAAQENLSTEVRLQALDALGYVYLKNLSTTQEIGALKKLISKDRNTTIKISAAKCLALSKDEEFLIEQTKLLGDNDPAVVAAAATLLGFGRYLRALPVLTALVSPFRLFESTSVIWAIGEIRSKDALPVLERALKESFRTNECLIAIGKIGELTSAANLAPFLLSGLFNQREAAFEALASLLHQNSDTPDLLKILGEELIEVIQNQLQKKLYNDSIKTRFYMLLCLARLGHNIEPAQIKHYLKLHLSKDEIGNIANYFVKRNSYKN